LQAKGGAFLDDDPAGEAGYQRGKVLNLLGVIRFHDRMVLPDQRPLPLDVCEQFMAYATRRPPPAACGSDDQGAARKPLRVRPFADPDRVADHVNSGMPFLRSGNKSQNLERGIEKGSHAYDAHDGAQRNHDVDLNTGFAQMMRNDIPEGDTAQ